MSYTTTSFSFSKLDQDVVLDGFSWEEIYLSCIYPSVKGYISCEVVKDLSGWLQSFTNCTSIISCEPFLPRSGSKSSYWQFWSNCAVIIAPKHGASCSLQTRCSSPSTNKHGHYICFWIWARTCHYLWGRVENLSVDYSTGNDCWAFVAPSLCVNRQCVNRQW